MRLLALLCAAFTYTALVHGLLGIGLGHAELTPRDGFANRTAQGRQTLRMKNARSRLRTNQQAARSRVRLTPVTEKRVTASQVIDEAGLKDLRKGAASVSTRHANFIVTEPSAADTRVRSVGIDEAARVRIRRHSH